MRTQVILLVVLLGSAIGGTARAAEDIASVRQKIDAAVAEVGAKSGNPQGIADDATFLRRVWVDLAGHTPPAPLARDFLDDKDPEKRSRMVARLLESEDFADHWGRVLAVWLTSERPISREGYDGRVLHRSLREALLRNEPYDRTVRELLAGSGVSDSSGSANFYLRYGADPPRLAGAVGKNLLGVTIQCAQCHDHPFARWKEDDFWGLAATFARVRLLESQGDDNLKAVVEARRGDLKRPDPDAPTIAEKKAEEKDGEAPMPKQVVVRPRLLNGKTPPDSGRRAAMADWVVARENPLFARNLVNRVWEQMFGKALVANLDDPASKADSLVVLGILAEDFAQNGHDLRRLLKILALSESYGRGTSPTAPTSSWARQKARPMSVDQLHASISQATGYEGEPDADEEEPDAAEDNPHRDDQVLPPADLPPGEADSGEGDADRAADALNERALTLQRVLLLLNGEFVREATRSAVRVSHAINGRQSDASRIEWACLATLARRPTAKEQEVLGTLVRGPNGLEDVYWVLINSSEFQSIR